MGEDGKKTEDGTGQKRVRVKTFEHDGLRYTIGALSFGQVERYFGEGRKPQVGDVVLASLQSGEPEAGWTLDKIKESFDLLGFSFLVRDIGELNGWNEDGARNLSAARSDFDGPTSSASVSTLVH